MDRLGNFFFDEIIINLYLETFNVSLLDASQAYTFLSSRLTVDSKRSIFWCWAHKNVSSAKSLIKNLVAHGKSFIKIKKRRGPNMDPWGTPYKTFRKEEEVLLSLTNWWRLERYDLKSSRTFPLIPYFGSFLSRISWLTESKAFARSRKIAQVVFLSSKFFSNFS